MRCFIALPLPEAASPVLAEATLPLRERWPGLSWVGGEGYHLTLAFLGEQGPAGLAAAKAAMASIAGIPSIAFSLPRLLVFPPRGPWRVVAAEAETELGSSLSLHKLHRLVNEALGREAEKAGLQPLNADWPDASEPGSEPRRPFRAHVTLARRPDAPRPGCPAPGEPLEPRLLEAARARLLEAPRPGESAGGFRFRALVLYKSELRPRGAVYTELDRLVLA